MHKLTLLLIGDTQRGEFRLALDAPPATADGETICHHAVDVTVAMQRIAAGEVMPEVVVFVQSYPGQVPHASVERLRRACPLARIVGLLGSWNEGEMRTGNPWPGVTRVYWHQWPLRMGRQLELLAAGFAAALALPPTATEEERILAEAPGKRTAHSGRAVVFSDDREVAGLLTAVCEARGLTAERLAQDSRLAQPPVLAFYDVTLCDAAALAGLRAAATAVYPAPLAVLAGFPRVDDAVAMIESGAAVVFSKPVDLNDVDWWIDLLLA